MPADRDVFDYYRATLERLAPGTPWVRGRHRAPPDRAQRNGPSARGGHARTGLEDNVRLDRHTLAPSNAALVRRTVEVCERHERPVATTAQAREVLGLRPIAA